MLNPNNYTPTQHPRPTSLLLPPSSTSSSTPFYTTATPTQFPTLLTPTSTPLAMTPNTIKSIEQSILQTLGEDAEESYMIESQQYSGNFVPPLPSSTSTITLINTWQGGQVSSEVEELKEKEQEKEIEQEPAQQQKKRKQPQKKVIPKKQPVQKKQKTSKKSKPEGPAPTEEEERRRVRRERNKQAAARCRKRRLDHTNKLVAETEGLEKTKRTLQTQITDLQNQKEELEFILEAHNCAKKMKQEVQVLSDLQNLQRPDHPVQKLKRPNTLNVNSTSPAVPISTPGIPINTPSNGIAGLGFEPLCSDWGVNTPTPLGEDNRVPESRDLSNKCSLVTPVNNPFKKLQDL